MKSINISAKDYAVRSKERISAHDKPPNNYQISDGRKIPELEDLGLTASRALGLVFLYCDIRGYSKLVEQRREATVVRILDMFLREIVLITEDFQGILGDFQGDRIMSLFPNPNDKKDPIYNAVEAAIMMQTIVKKVISPHLGLTDNPLECGIGIDYDERVLVTRLGPKSGIRERNKRVFIGSAANYAAKLEDRAEGGETLISGIVYANLPDYMENLNWKCKGELFGRKFYGYSGRYKI